MNRDRIEGSWKQITGKARELWAQLNHDRLGVLAGKREQRAGAVQEGYGIYLDEAVRQLEEFRNRHRNWKSIQDSTGSLKRH